MMLVLQLFQLLFLQLTLEYFQLLVLPNYCYCSSCWGASNNCCCDFYSYCCCSFSN